MTEIIHDWKEFKDVGIFMDDAIDVLEEWDDICEKMGIKRFLTFGIVLGLIREGKFVTGDTDLDVGVIVSVDELKKLQTELYKNGFGASNCGRGWGRGQSINVHKNGIRVEIWYRFHIETLPFIKDFTTYKLRDREYNLPSPPEEYLDVIYQKFGGWRNLTPEYVQNHGTAIFFW